VKPGERIAWALRVSVADATSRRQHEACRGAVLFVYAAHVNEQTGLAWLSMETLEKETRWERKSILPARRALVDLGLLIEAGRHGRSGLPRFRLSYPEVGTSEAVDISADSVGNPAQESQSRDFREISGVPKSESQESRSRDLTLSRSRDTEQVIEQVNEQRDRAREARLSGWKPEPQQLEWARQERPDIDLEHCLGKFLKHNEGARLARKAWEERFTSWVLSERAKPKPPAPRQETEAEVFAHQHNGREFVHVVDGRRFRVLSPSGQSPAQVLAWTPEGSHTAGPLDASFLDAFRAGRIEEASTP
jgi:hypothetical protein